MTEDINIFKKLMFEFQVSSLGNAAIKYAQDLQKEKSTMPIWEMLRLAASDMEKTRGYSAAQITGLMTILFSSMALNEKARAVNWAPAFIEHLTRLYKMMCGESEKPVVGTPIKVE